MSYNNSIAILGIHTGIGKTICSAVITEALNAHYWKPVQAGLEERDLDTVASLITDGHSRVHEEAVKLKLPMSPHAAAEAEGVEIDYTAFQWPGTSHKLIVETAGGILSPMSATTTMADFVAHYHLPAILVTQNYLGSINHTLMSIEVLKARGIRLLGMVLSGDPYPSSESFITGYSGVPILSRVPRFETLTQAAIAKAAKVVKADLAEINF